MVYMLKRKKKLNEFYEIVNIKNVVYRRLCSCICTCRYWYCLWGTKDNVYL